MRDMLLVSRWFYAGGASMLEWLAAGVLAGLAAVAVSRFVKGRVKGTVVFAGSTLCGAGAVVCAGMIVAEVLVFELTVPLAAAAYVVLAASFAGLVAQLRSGPLMGKLCAQSAILASAALGYLFVYGAVPPIVELQAKAPGDRPGTLAITEFADFECPPCAVQDEIMEKVWAAYSDRITYSFRHFPKARHPHAEPAAVMSQCAAESGAFWQTKRLLFSNQARLAEIVGRAELPTISPAETERFARCVTERATLGSVVRDRETGASLGIRVTPSIIVGDKLIEGVIQYPRLVLIVERELRDRSVTVARQTSSPFACGSCSE
jgi:protein-disulfide isomerase